MCFLPECWNPACSPGPRATAPSPSQTRSAQTPTAIAAATRSPNASSAPRTGRASWCSSSNGSCFLFSAAFFKALWVKGSMTVNVLLTLKTGPWRGNLKKCHGSGIFRSYLQEWGRETCWTILKRNHLSFPVNDGCDILFFFIKRIHFSVK